MIEPGAGNPRETAMLVRSMYHADTSQGRGSHRWSMRAGPRVQLDAMYLWSPRPIAAVSPVTGAVATLALVGRSGPMVSSQ